MASGGLFAPDDGGVVERQEQNEKDVAMSHTENSMTPENNDIHCW